MRYMAKRTSLVLLTAGMTLAHQAIALAQDAPQSLAAAHILTGGLNLSPTDSTGHSAHIMPTVQAARALPAVTPSATPALTYHGGPIMPTIGIYNIFWVGELSNKSGTASLTAHYEAVANDLAFDYAGKTIDSNNTQYYQKSPVRYISGLSTFASGYSYAGEYIDTDAFPASGCTDSETPGNCITDAQLQAEITKVLGIKGWTGGFNKVFVVYTGQGEGSCFDSTSASCAYTAYCAYHSYISGTTPVVYANMPFALTEFCFDPTTGQGSPTGDANADAVVNVASHEITEAITDPELTAWWDPINGEEISDLCAWTFLPNGYDAGKANQLWNGRYYDLQLAYDNHTASCVQLGP